MKLAVQKNHLGGQILDRSLDPSKKWRFPKFYLKKSFHLFHGPKRVASY